MAIRSGNNQPAEPHIDSDALGPYAKRAYRVTLVDQSGNPVTSLGGGGNTGTVNQGTNNSASPWYVQWNNQSVSVSNFPATQNVNNAQIGSTAIATGTGAANTGTQRVAVSSDSFPSSQTVLPLGITPTRTVVTVQNSSVQLVPANANRRVLQIVSDGTSAIGISQLGSALTANTLAGGADTILPATPGAQYIPPITTKSAVTAFGTATAQTVVVLEWSQ